MKNNLNEIIKERLENRLEWKNYLGWLLTHRELHKCAKRKFYENKPFLNLVLKVYFLLLISLIFVVQLSYLNKTRSTSYPFRFIKEYIA